MRLKERHKGEDQNFQIIAIYLKQEFFNRSVSAVSLILLFHFEFYIMVCYEPFVTIEYEIHQSVEILLL